MTISIPDFWKLAIKSRLLSLEDCQRLEQEFTGVKGAADQGNAATLGEWLVATGVLSRFQVKTFLAGRPGPFIYGDYYVYDRVRTQEGRLANLFRAMHLPTHHPVLLHFIGGATVQDPQAWEAVVRQVGWACWTGNPHVADCYQLLDLGKIKLVAIENLTGETVAARLAHGGPLPPAEACRLAREAALGLSRLHQLGQVHGQVRPDNLWIDAAGTLKILQTPLAPELLSWPGPIDWGSPEQAEKNLVAADYAAPELAQPGRAPDATTDIYALGISLFQMLAGSAPFAGGDIATKLARQANEPLPNLDLFGVPPQLAQLLAYLTAKDPAHRYQQAQEVANALGYFVDPAAQAAIPQPSPTAAAFDAWLAGQSRVPGAAPGSIPTSTEQAAAAQQQPAQPEQIVQQPVEQPQPGNAWPENWSNGQAPVEQAGGYAGFDPASDYRATQYPADQFPQPQYPQAQYPQTQYPTGQEQAPGYQVDPYYSGAPQAPQPYGASAYSSPYAPAAAPPAEYAPSPVEAPQIFAAAAPQENSFFESLQSNSREFDPAALIPAANARHEYPDMESAVVGATSTVAPPAVAAPTAPAAQKRGGLNLDQMLDTASPKTTARSTARKSSRSKTDPKILAAIGAFAAVVGIIAIVIVVRAVKNDSNDEDIARIQRKPADSHTSSTLIPGATSSSGPASGSNTNTTTNTSGTTPTTPPPAKPPNPETTNPPTTAPPEVATTNGPNGSQVKTEVIADDGNTLWASPTAGASLSLDYVAAGAQVIFSVRPAQIVRRSNGDLILPSFGPWGDIAQGALKQATGFDLGQIDRVTTILHDSGDGQLVPTYVIRTLDKIAAESLQSAWGNPKAATEGTETYYQGATLAYYLPGKEQGKVLCLGPAAQIKDIIQNAGGAPRVSRYMERMIRYTDGDRDITLLFLPPYLLGDGKSFFTGPLASLQKPFASFFGDDTPAAILSLHFQGDMFLELRLLAPADKDPDTLSSQFASRVRSLSAVVENSLDALNLHPYDRKLLRRYPEWMRLLGEFTRSGTEDDQAVLRCYLPSVATHNLLMASELALAEQGSPGGASPGGATAGPAKAATIADLLKKKTTLTFPRDTLEKSLQLLFDDVGVKYEILGGDLQLEGITKNQSFGLNETDKPAGEILRKIMALANPDGKLIYVIKPKAPGQPDMVFITTRASAAKRGDKLPPELVQPATPPKKKP